MLKTPIGLTLGVRYRAEKTNRGATAWWIANNSWPPCVLEMFAWLTNNGWHMARQEAAKLPTPPLPLDSPLLLLLHQCPMQRGQYTHPAFVGQECQEFRLLPSSLLLPNKVLPPIPHLTQQPPTAASWWFYCAAGRVSGGLRMVWCCTLSAHSNLIHFVWCWNTCCQEVSCRLSSKPRFDEVFRVGCGALRLVFFIFKSSLNMTSLM